MWRLPALLQRPRGVISARKPAKMRTMRFETAKNVDRSWRATRLGSQGSRRRWVGDGSESRMRVVLAQPRGFCAGVVRAIEIVDRALEKYGQPVYVRHEIVHNRHVVENLKAKGAIFVEELDEVPDGARDRVQRPRRAPSRWSRKPAGRGLPVLDATCPLVSKVHNQGKRYVCQGRTLVLIGHAGHPEVEGTIGQVGAPGAPDLHRGATCADLDLPIDTPLAYVTQTTLSVDDTTGGDRRAEGPLHRHRRPRHRRHLLRHPASADRRARAVQGRRRDPGGRRQEQLQLQPPARDRPRGGHPELSDRRRHRARSDLARGQGDRRPDRRRLGARRNWLSDVIERAAQAWPRSKSCRWTASKRTSSSGFPPSFARSSDHRTRL